MKIELEVSEENESTAYPWWIIIDPEPLEIGSSVNSIASCITGPFFSREVAHQHLRSRNYRFSDMARVYCHTGHSSHEYKNAIRDAEKREWRIMGDRDD